MIAANMAEWQEEMNRPYVDPDSVNPYRGELDPEMMFMFHIEQVY